MEILWHSTTQGGTDGLGVLDGPVEGTHALGKSITTMDSKIEESGANARGRSSGYTPATRESEQQSQKVIKWASTTYGVAPGFGRRGRGSPKVGAWEQLALPTKYDLKAVTNQRLRFIGFKKNYGPNPYTSSRTTKLSSRGQ